MALLQGVKFIDVTCCCLHIQVSLTRWNRGRYPHFRGLEQRGSTVYRGVLISGVGIERFHCIERCTHFRMLEKRGSTIHSGVFSIFL